MASTGWLVGLLACKRNVRAKDSLDSLEKATRPPWSHVHVTFNHSGNIKEAPRDPKFSYARSTTGVETKPVCYASLHRTSHGMVGIES